MNNLTEDFLDDPEIRTLLADFLGKNFSLEELENFCFFLNTLFQKLFQWAIDYENLKGETKQSKARELVAYVDRRGADKSIFILLKETIKMRSGRDWQKELKLKCPCSLSELVNLLRQKLDDNQLVNLFVNHGVNFSDETPVGNRKQEIKQSKIIGSILEVYKRGVIPGLFETLLKDHPKLNLVAELSLSEEQITELGLDKPVAQGINEDAKPNAKKLDAEVLPYHHGFAYIQESTARMHWLQAFGFIKDPFSENSLNGEQDPLLASPDASAFVLPPQYSEIRGKPQEPGFRYIFGIAGSGKSSLRRLIKWEFDNSILPLNLTNTPKTLAIEYLEHIDQPHKDVGTHVKMIVRTIIQKVEETPGIFASDTGHETIQELKKLSENAEVISLARTMKLCRSEGIDGISILVDDIDAQYDEDLEIGFNRIRSLAARYDLLVIPGLIFKFFLPYELYELCRQILPFHKFVPYTIQWSEEQLRTLLNQRIEVCLEEAATKILASKMNDTSPNDLVTAVFSELCDEQIKHTIVDDMVKLGIIYKQPRIMWLFGYHLLSEHLRQLETQNEDESKLIGRPTFMNALKKLEDQLPKMDFSPFAK